MTSLANSMAKRGAGPIMGSPCIASLPILGLH